ncbi:uncharacterized protein LACBIDRAFT_326666 [Laccaria bicolor S238N-H82]|uniref:Predicted protein n=1 Tax=Laccaria bicolor (strain S238N-H82 / ATCC MYA-4686) TaxID=486041 RepID=B0D9E6_LACBS|nr:uncharacterized protein LACBIDRAFT_326666 [Laccaria bicolor S238N-H82]EDR09002.1 predicted protein [Laccaria bicolor S238N-H82]|eukprot:XP_001880315.1 predicted protein [Laccaria bicolor S238N-H82]
MSGAALGQRVKIYELYQTSWRFVTQIKHSNRMGYIGSDPHGDRPSLSSLLPSDSNQALQPYGTYWERPHGERQSEIDQVVQERPFPPSQRLRHDAENPQIAYTRGHGGANSLLNPLYLTLREKCFVLTPSITNPNERRTSRNSSFGVEAREVSDFQPTRQ